MKCYSVEESQKNRYTHMDQHMLSSFILDIAINVHFFLNSFLESNVCFCPDVLSCVYQTLLFLFFFSSSFSLSVLLFLPIVLWECEKMGLKKL